MRKQSFTDADLLADIKTLVIGVIRPAVVSYFLPNTRPELFPYKLHYCRPISLFSAYYLTQLLKGAGYIDSQVWDSKMKVTVNVPGLTETPIKGTCSHAWNYLVHGSDPGRNIFFNAGSKYQRDIFTYSPENIYQHNSPLDTVEIWSKDKINVPDILTGIDYYTHRPFPLILQAIRPEVEGNSFFKYFKRKYS